MLKSVAVRRAFAALAASLLASAAGAAPPPGFEQRVEQLRKQFGVPGVTIAIVENGKTTLAHAVSRGGR